MCIVCKLWQQERLTIKEAKKALWEMVDEENADRLHIQELYAKLEQKERQKHNEEAKD